MTLPKARTNAVLALTVAALAGAAVSGTAASDTRPRILVFSKTTGFRHDSIAAAHRAVRELAQRHGIAVEATEDGAAFTPARLARFDAVVFLLTTGDVLDTAQQAAFERWFRAGGGFVGVHSAADTEYEWAWYGRMLGARFRSHPPIQTARILLETRRHPSTARIPTTWIRTDEWYNFARRPTGVQVLARLDESSYSPGEGAMGASHPIAWAHEFEGGRSWYTGGGHAPSAYAERLFRTHLIGGIRYAAGLTPPRIVAAALVGRGRRVVVSVRYARCSPCRGTLRVGGSRTVRLRFVSGRAVGTSPPVARGRHQVTIQLTDPSTGLYARARRRVQVG